MGDKFNVAKEKIGVNFTNRKELTVGEALKTFNIERVELPTRDGKLVEIKNGFVGSVKVKFQNGLWLALSLLKSRFASSSGLYYIPDVRASIILPDENNSIYSAVGNTIDGAEQDDGRKRSYASAFMPKDMLSFVRTYTNLLAKDVEYVTAQVSAPAKEDASTDSENTSLVV